MTIKQRLRFFKGLLVNNRLVRVLHNNPIVLRNRFAFVHLVADGFIDALHHISDVHLVL